MNCTLRRLLFLLSFVAMSIVAHAEPFEWGVEGGVLLNRISFSKDIYESSNRLGFFVGPKIKYVIPKVGLGIDAAALYANRTANFEDLNGDIDNKNLSYIEIPVNLRWQIGSEKIGLYVATGPQWDWHIGKSTFEPEDGNIKAVFSNNYFSWNIGAGIMMFSHVQLGVNYGLPMSKSGSVKDIYGTVIDDAKTVKMKNRQWQIRLAYYF